MNFHVYSPKYTDTHAILSPSKYHWVEYTPEKLRIMWSNYYSSEKGTKLHEFAANAINLRIRPAEDKKTINMYINDCITEHMKTEVTLVYSDNCYGKADAISYDGKLLKVFDLKTGRNVSSIIQLEIYAALFCLEYNINPSTISFDLRIYQNDNVTKYAPDERIITKRIHQITTADSYIEKFKEKNLEENY